LNNRDQVVGFSNVPGDLGCPSACEVHPFLWGGGVLRDLGTFGGSSGVAAWINDAGEVVGWANLSGDQAFHAFLWKDGVKTDLGTLDGDSTSDAHGINSKGQVVGSSENGPSSRGFLWENGKMFDLNTLISPGSKLNLDFPTIINDRGEIAGQGQLPDGDIHAFLLIPCEVEHADDDGCNGGDTPAIQNNPAAISPASTNVSQGRLTPENLAVLRDRFARLFRGLGIWPHR